MEKEYKVDLLDYLVILVKWKKLLIFVLIPTLVISYLAIYFLIDEQYDADALIVPADDQSLGGISSLLSGLGNNLPFDIGGSTTNQDMNLYNTIIYSRTNLMNIIDKFDLVNVYNLNKKDKDYIEQALRILGNSINANETENMAYQIEVRAKSPDLAANITNYIVDLLINKIIELRTQKSKNNRIFLEDRISEIRANLTASEDSLQAFQKKSGIIYPEEQFKGIVTAYTELETNLITKQIQKSIIEELKGKDSPSAKNLELEVTKFENKLKEMKRKGDTEGVIPSLKNLPENATDYVRYYREVEINNAILQFITPLYEQAKIEEKKDIPSLQVIDYAVPPAKKSFPPRTIFTLLITFAIFLITFIFILFKENEKLQSSDKMLYIKKNLLRWKSTV